MSLADKVLAGQGALVTGSTSGIGLGIARIFAASGAKVMLNGFGKPDEIAAARAEIGALMGLAEAPYSAADMSKPAEIRTMVAQAQAELGSLDILVNNAGIQFVAPVQDFPEEKWDAIIAINMSSNYHAIKAALPAMLARGRGRIINVASAHGLVASPYKSAYVAAKHGVVGMTKSIALEVAQSPITCNAICPGFVRTPWPRRRWRRSPPNSAFPKNLRCVTACWKSSPPSAGSKWRMWRAWRSIWSAPVLAR